MAGGGIKQIYNTIRGGSDGATFIPNYNEATGELEWSNNRNLINPPNMKVKGADGKDGKDGAKGDTGAKLVSQVLVGKDENGGNIYEQTFDDGTTARFIAPKGDGTNITIDSQFSLTSQNPVQNSTITGALQNIDYYIELFKNEIPLLWTNKQDKLTAGTNITITKDGVISATSGGTGGNVEGTVEPEPDTIAKRTSYGELRASNADIGGPASTIDGYIPENEVVTCKLLKQYALPNDAVEQEVNESENPVSSKAVNTTIQNFASSYMQMVKDLTVEQVIIYDRDVIEVENNKDYHASGDISNLDIRISSGNILCSFMFKIIDSGNFNISITGSTGYIGKAPDFKNGETWELNIHNGIIASGKVVSE